MERPQEIVVVGGGLAGLETIVALREHGYTGRLTLVGAERHPPYERPPLSKEVLLSDAGHTPLDVDWPGLDVDLRLSCRAQRLGDGVVETSDGPLRFDRLAIATGAAPLPLGRAGSASHVHTLRNIDDALAIRTACEPGVRVVVVGAGWIGMEVATALARRGCSVTVLEAAAVPLAAALPPEIGARAIPWFDEAGVALRLGAKVTDVETHAVRLTDGSMVPAECVVIGIGVRPATGWLEGSRVELDAAGRVLTDSSLRTNQSGVVAVGDCTAFESRRFGTRLHVEHWDNAQRAPDVAAQTLLGMPAQYDPVPYFWSESFGRMIQYSGYHADDQEVVVREEGRTWSACWLVDGRMTAILGVDRPRDVAQARRLIEAGTLVEPARLADPGTAVGASARP